MTNAKDSVYAWASAGGTVKSNVGSLLMLTPKKDAGGYTRSFNAGAETA